MWSQIKAVLELRPIIFSYETVVISSPGPVVCEHAQLITEKRLLGTQYLLATL